MTAIAFLTLWFVGIGIYFAFNTPPGIPPDEIFHLQVIRLYQTSHSLFPFTRSWSSFNLVSPEFGKFGRATTYGYLYHLFLGNICRLLAIEPYEWPSIVLLRLINLIFGLLSLRFSFLIFRKLLQNKLLILTAYTVQCSLLMFCYLSASVNYDNLLLLCCIAAGYWALLFLEKPSWPVLRLLIISLSLACLSKQSGLLFAFILLLGMLPALLYNYWNSFSLSKVLDHILSFRKTPDVFLTLVLLVSLAASLEFYLANYWRYESLLPECEKVFSAEQCNNRLAQSYQGEAARLAEEYHSGRLTKMGMGAYFIFWLREVINTSIGIYGHHGITFGDMAAKLLLPFLALALLSGIWHIKKLSVDDLMSLAVVVSYCLFLFYYNHYRGYREDGVALNGINGRYTYLVLPYFLCLTVKCFNYLLPKRYPAFLPMLAIMFFLPCELMVISLPTFQNHVMKPPPPEVYREQVYYPGPVYDREFRIIENPEVE